MRRRLSLVSAFVFLAGTLVLVPSVLGSHAIVGPNVKVTDDNSNVDGGIGNVTPSKDAQNRQSNETTVAISHLRLAGHRGRRRPDRRVRQRLPDGAVVRRHVDADLPLVRRRDDLVRRSAVPERLQHDGSGLPDRHVARGPGVAAPRPRRGRRPGGALRPGRQPARRRDRVQPQPRPGRAPARHGRVRRALQVHARLGGDGEHDDERRRTAELHLPRDDDRRPRRSRLRDLSVRRLRGQLHRQAVDGSRSQLPVRKPVLGQRLLRGHELPRCARRIAGHVQPLDRRRRDVVVSAQISNGGRHGASHNQGADIAVAPNGTIYVAFEAFSQRGWTRSTSSSRRIAAATGRSRWP